MYRRYRLVDDDNTSLQQMDIGADEPWSTTHARDVLFPTMHDASLVASLCYYATVMLVCRLLRSAVVRACAPHTRRHWLCVVGAFQTLSCSFENGHVRKQYGNVGYVLALVFVGTWHCMTCVAGTSGNPCNPVERYARGRCSVRALGTHVGLQAIAAPLARGYSRLFWSLRLSRDHGARWERVECDSDLTLSLWSGFAIEFVATLAMRLISLINVTHHAACERMAKRIIDAAVTVTGLRLTGMYMNPLNASNQTLGCRGTSLAGHLLVYWVAPLSAAICAVVVLRCSTPAPPGGRQQNGTARALHSDAAKHKEVKTKVS